VTTFFAARDRQSTLLHADLQRILEACLFEPGAWSFGVFCTDRRTHPRTAIGARLCIRSVAQRIDLFTGATLAPLF